MNRKRLVLPYQKHCYRYKEKEWWSEKQEEEYENRFWERSHFKSMSLDVDYDASVNLEQLLEISGDTKIVKDQATMTEDPGDLRGLEQKDFMMYQMRKMLLAKDVVIQQQHMQIQRLKNEQVEKLKENLETSIANEHESFEVREVRNNILKPSRNYKINN